MTIYSGFPTRRDELRYDQLVHSLLLLYQNRLVALSGFSDDVFRSQVGTVLRKLRAQEQSKYQEPKHASMLLNAQLRTDNTLKRKIRTVRVYSEANEERSKKRVQSKGRGKTIRKQLNAMTRPSDQTMFGTRFRTNSILG